jgi:carbamoyltransferase
MNIIGASVAKTQHGAKINDGGAAILINGKLISAISEERITRIKHEAGFKNSLQYVLNEANLNVSDIDLFVLSSCMEPVLSPSCELYISENETLQDVGINRNKVVICEHHLSHAYYAFFASPFAEAVVIIVDGEGNIIGNMKDVKGNFEIMAPNGEIIGQREGLYHWESIVSKQSQFFATPQVVQNLHSDIIQSNKTGIGEVYRYFTRFLGFGSYVNAGKIMGLSSYGTKKLKVPLFNYEKETGEVYSVFNQNYLKPNWEISEYLKKNNINITERNPKSKILPIHKDIAMLVQDETNIVMLEKIKFWSKKMNCKNVCISGGVALNSVANGFVIENTNYNLYVPPAPSDTGQPIGNAIYGAVLFGEKLDRVSLRNPYTGRTYNHIPKSEFKQQVFNSDKTLYEAVCKLFLQDKIVGWFQGGSEIGPRALGNRSILASPLNAKMKDTINEKVKFRENFRPFAPSIPKDDVNNFFIFKGDSPYMSFVCKVKSDKIPAVTHIDNTARLQTVEKELNPKYYSLLKTFQGFSEIPVLLNTSFNIAGDPIVETPEDALHTFINSGMDILVVNNTLFYK